MACALREDSDQTAHMSSLSTLKIASNPCSCGQRTGQTARVRRLVRLRWCKCNLVGKATFISLSYLGSIRSHSITFCSGSFWQDGPLRSNFVSETGPLSCTGDISPCIGSIVKVPVRRTMRCNTIPVTGDVTSAVLHISVTSKIRQMMLNLMMHSPFRVFAN